MGLPLNPRVQAAPNQHRSLNPADDALHIGESSLSKMRRIKWTLLLSSFVVEGLSSAFEQLRASQKPIYAFMAILMASLGLIVSIIELSYRIQEQNMIIWRLLGDALENFGLFGSIWQCIYSIVDYVYIDKKFNNPIKMSVLLLIFLVCVAISGLYGNSHQKTTVRADIPSSSQGRSHRRTSSI